MEVATINTVVSKAGGLVHPQEVSLRPSILGVLGLGPVMVHLVVGTIMGTMASIITMGVTLAPTTAIIQETLVQGTTRPLSNAINTTSTTNTTTTGNSGIHLQGHHLPCMDMGV